MEQIISTTIDSFDFGLILVINVASYFVIKFYEELFSITKWTKRFITLIVAIVIGCIYYFIDTENTKLILNSVIISPVSWDWIFKPIMNKLKIDYKNYSRDDGESV